MMTLIEKKWQRDGNENVIQGYVCISFLIIIPNVSLLVIKIQYTLNILINQKHSLSKYIISIFYEYILEIGCISPHM